MAEIPLTFTIEDFVGAIIPGMVWSVEFFTLNQLVGGSGTDISHKTAIVPSTFDVAITYSQGYAPTFYVGFIVCSFILGYISNAFPTKISETVSVLLCKILLPASDVLKISADGKVKANSFPYGDFHERQQYYKVLREMVDRCIGIQVDAEGIDFFNLCKRMLKTKVPNRLWEKIAHLEAQSRMLSSLLLASIGNIILVFIALVQAATQHYMLSSYVDANSRLLLWLLLSFLFTAILAYTFQYRRRQEVKAIYFYSLLYFPGNLTADTPGG